ncbi:DUF4352 domain-containing protein [Solwaraspora sp. WMMD1047]|uniref:DUF4352 domain-containing protein n=1 Tax=Solwaraspora sp. WMMD1047 TaxID=3016102 RepID=UPI002417CD05|nr:DUF4352 domain-containing protein [Solwaraspora sp. WMMD1047]MDG4830456.1 DUF4352 domain-containing protein [Solwaraspora sp. WMMD1047]
MRKLTIAGLLLTATVALGCGAADTTDTTGSDDEAAAGAGPTAEGQLSAEEKPATIGDQVRDGKFEFTVKSIKCGVNKIGSDLLGERAQGQFCLVTVHVKNIGKEAQYFDDSSQRAYDANDVEYSTDSGAAIYANEDAATFLNEINPGNQVTGVLVFDIPKKVKLTRLELHDSPFSGGVTVTLT